MIYPIVLAGGSGSRLWPLSRTLNPKQFLKLTHSSKSMLQQTIERLDGLNVASPFVICNEQHRFIAAEQLQQIHQLNHNLLLEPISKNTAPAITLAALHSLGKENNPILLILPADHFIQAPSLFHQAVRNAEMLVEQGYLVTFGITTDRPEIGFGYLKKGEKLQTQNHIDAYKVAQFIEKPDLKSAEKYHSSQEYFWNSGMFMFKAKDFLAELSQYAPEILSHCLNALKHSSNDLDFIRVNKEYFNCCPENSVDYALMEKSQKVVMLPLNAGWSDVGSWDSLWQKLEKDPHGNIQVGDILHHNSSNNYIYTDSGLIAAVDINNLVIVKTHDALLVANKDKVQNVKHIVKQLKDQQRTEHHVHREIHRPWGSYDKIISGEHYKVNKVEIKPNRKTATQKHYHRSEHLIILFGTAKLQLNNEDILLTENQSIYIPVGATHSIENPGRVPLIFIEVQSGSYLGEDDIIRI